MSETPHVPPSYTPPPPPPGGGYNPPPPPPPPIGGGTAPNSDRTLMVVLSYLGILALIPLLTKKDDAEVQWHAKNGLALAIAEVAVFIVFMILGFALRGPLAALGCGLTLVQCVLWIGFLVIHIMAIMKGVGGGRMRLPVITDFAEKM